MIIDIQPGQAGDNDSGIVTPAGLPANSAPGGMTEYAYESALEATRAERDRQAREADWDADPDWQAFQALCYSDTEAPDAASIQKGVNHLITAAPTRPCAGAMPSGDGIAPRRGSAGYQAGYWQSSGLVSVSG